MRDFVRQAQPERAPHLDTSGLAPASAEVDHEWHHGCLLPVFFSRAASWPCTLPPSPMAATVVPAAGPRLKYHCAKAQSNIEPIREAQLPMVTAAQLDMAAAGELLLAAPPRPGRPTPASVTAASGDAVCLAHHAEPSPDSAGWLHENPGHHW
jgi:hypothetical protein